MREELLTRMIRIYGFEDAAVIQFAKLMEAGISDETLELIVECSENSPLDEDE